MEIYTFNQRLEEVLNQYDKYGHIEQSVIDFAEKELGVIFPYQYRDFLSKFGAIVGEGCEIYGLPTENVDECPYWQNVVTVTKRLRKLQQIGTENHFFIPISSNGENIYYFINTEYFNVTEIWAISNEEKSIVSNNLYEFIIKQYDYFS